MFLEPVRQRNELLVVYKLHLLGFKSFETATSILSGVEAMHMIKKEQIDLRDQSIQNQKNHSVNQTNPNPI